MDTTFTWRTETGRHISLLPFGRDEPIRVGIWIIGETNYGLSYIVPSSHLNRANHRTQFYVGHKRIVLNDLFLFKEYQNPIMGLA